VGLKKTDPTLKIIEQHFCFAGLDSTIRCGVIILAMQVEKSNEAQSFVFIIKDKSEALKNHEEAEAANSQTEGSGQNQRGHLHRGRATVPARWHRQNWGGVGSGLVWDLVQRRNWNGKLEELLGTWPENLCCDRGTFGRRTFGPRV
jgi:hypothetical protein